MALEVDSSGDLPRAESEGMYRVNTGQAKLVFFDTLGLAIWDI
jgi:hypothetical protein